nr:hypothetical protein GCM10020093_120070 [Planobispora longispora]
MPDLDDSVGAGVRSDGAGGDRGGQGRQPVGGRLHAGSGQVAERDGPGALPRRLGERDLRVEHAPEVDDREEEEEDHGEHERRLHGGGAPLSGARRAPGSRGPGDAARRWGGPPGARAA